MTPPRRTEQVGTPGAPELVGAGAALLLLAVAMVLGLTHPAAAGALPPVELAFGAAFGGLAVAGALAARAQPANPVGRTLVVASLLFVVPVAAGEYAVHALPGERGWPGGAAAAWLASWPQPLAYVLLLVVLPLHFPDGRLPAPAWRWPLCLLVAVAGTAALAMALAPGPLAGVVEADNPIGVAALEGPASAVARTAPGLITLGAVASLVAVVRRARHATGLARQQFRVVGLAVALMVVVLAAQAVLDAGSLAPPGVLAALRVVAFLGLPVALVMAMARYRLYDVDRFVDRAVVYALVSVAVVLLYVLSVALLGGALGREVDLGASVLAAGVAAVLFPLLRDGVQRTVARRLYGWRDDPYVVLRELSHRLEQAVPARRLDDAVEALRTSLRLPHLVVRSTTGEDAVVTGAPCDGPGEPLPLKARGELVGTLVAWPRSGERELSGRDRRVLADAAGQIAGAVSAAELAGALQRSRERLVRAREEERRRLQRDLHDGLGPLLTGVVLGLDGVVALAGRDAGGAATLAGKVRQDAVDAVTEVRRVVHGLRPPALDQLGLVPALRQRAASLSTSALAFTVEAQELPLLPAAVEVACYSVAVEAMHNAARHSGGRTCCVRLTADARLRLEVADDGSGVHGPAGVGSSSMRERADELGGSIEVRALAGSGTTVVLDLPVEAR